MTAHTKGPTLEEMHSTWLRRKKATWPPSFEEAMQSEIYKRLLMIECLHGELRKVLPIVVPPIPDRVSSPVTDASGTVSERPPATRRNIRTGFWMDSRDDDEA